MTHTARTGRLLSLATVAFALAGVRAEDPPAGDRPVEAELKRFAAGLGKKAPPEAIQTMQTGVDELAASGITKTALKVGDKAPGFELPDAAGNTIRLDDLLKKGPVVLTWYRGGWCPYCNIGLKGLLKVEPQLRAAGATLVALSPETPEAGAETSKKDELTFNVLSDKGNATARRYGIAYKVPDKVAALMKGFGVDLPKANGDESGELPLSATYLVDGGGTIRWAFVDADYRKRAEPADVVAALTGLQDRR